MKRLPDSSNIKNPAGSSPVAKAASSLLVAVIIAGCASATKVSQISARTKPGRGGNIYLLPTTALDITVPIEKTTKTPPEDPAFAEATPVLFGEEPIKQRVQSFKVGDPSVTPIGIPDPSKRFYVEPTAGPFSDSSITLNFTNHGVLTSAAVEAENKTVEFIVSTIEAGAKIVGSAAKFISAEDPEKKLPEAVVQLPLKVKLSHDRLVSALRTKDNILQSPGNDVAVRLEEINKIIATETARFFGSTKKETWNAKFRVVPENPSERISLFAVSSGEGVTRFHTDPLNKIPSGFFNPTSAKSSRDETRANIVQVEIKARGLVSEDEHARLFRNPGRGLHYNIPAPGTVRLFADNAKLATFDVSFGQFGGIGFLPRSTGSRKLHQEITLDGTTGALLAVKSVSNAFDPKSINRVGDAISGAMDNYDPKLRAERERDIAQAKYEKLDYEMQARKKRRELDSDSE